MNEPNYLAFIVPAFFLFLGIEYFVALQKDRQDLFHFENSIANISVGIAERMLSLFITSSFYSLFYYIYENYALYNIPNHWLVWILLILATDLVWYWYHRLGHEVNILWAVHIVHHQSDEFNFTVSARITVFQALIRNLFWCALPWVGFHPSMVITILIVHGIYSFFTHTQLVGKLGWLENILITPSLHGVHHASNEKYLDKNYGDIFVFWDKLFGTFQKEEEKPVYGLTHPLNSYSFIWQHFHYFMEIALAFQQAKSWKTKLSTIFGRPENMSASIRQELEVIFLPHKNIKKATKLAFQSYLNVQLIVSTIILFFFTLFFNYLGSLEKFFIAIGILITLINCGALLEQRKWIYYLEYVRFMLPISYLSYYWENPIIFVVAINAIVFIDNFTPAQKWYLKLIYK